MQTDSIILTPEGEAPILTTLAQLAADDWSIAEEEQAIRDTLARFEVWVGGGGAAPTYRIEVGPLQAECLGITMTTDDLTAEWERYTRAHGLPHRSADEVLAEIAGPEADREVVRWIEAFIAVWEQRQAIEDARDPMMGAAEREEWRAAGTIS